MDIKLTKDTVEEVISELTIREKAELVTGGLPYGTKEIKRLGIPGALLNDSMAGMNFRQLFADFCSMETGEGILYSLRRGEKILHQLRTEYRINPDELDEEEMVCYEAIKKHLGGNLDRITSVTSFPAGITLGSTWNPEVVHQCAEALAREFDTFGVDVILTPNVNIQRDPLGGRLFESYSEDPYLTGEMGSAYVRGIQKTGLLADPKHFSANNHERERKGINVHVSERALHEIYFPGFRACVQKGNAKTIMSAYNKLNGTACSANEELLTELLRKEWGFDGIVISDWGGVYDSGASLRAGNDLEMPANPDIPGLEEDVRAGRVPEEILDRAVRRILHSLLEMPCMKGHQNKEIDTSFSVQSAYQAVAEGAVLLKNESVLPIPEQAEVVLLGEGAYRLMETGSGSAEVLRGRPSRLIDCMRAIGGSHVRDGSLDEDAEYAVIVGKARGQEGIDREKMLLDEEDEIFVTKELERAKKAGKKTVLILNIAGPVDVSAYEKNADAILSIFVPGCQGSAVLSDILYGRVNPSGKLAVTFPGRYEDCPTSINFPGYNKEIWYGEGIYVGYRYYDTKKIEPKYPFGYGLSYTQFAIRDLEPEKQTFEDEPIRFSVKVANTGDRAGKEVVQIYIRHDNPTLQKPDKELRAFRKIELAPGEEKTLHFEIGLEELASYDEKFKKFITEPGIYTILAGNSSRNIASEAKIVVKCYDEYGYNHLTRIVTMWSDARCLDLYQKYFGDKCPSKHYNDLLTYTPDYPVGQALRERIPESCYDSPDEKEKAILQFFDEVGRLDIGKFQGIL